MKKLILLIALTLVTLPQLSFAEDEVIWETEQIPYLHGVLVAPQGELLYNINGKTLEIRRISDGKKIDSIVIDNVPNYLYQMSITDDGRYMAFSGDNPYVIIYDLQERREVKRITTIAYEREEYGKNVVYDTDEWISSSISPDGTKITGIATATDRTMTNFVVIDIATEKVLLEQRRIIYDHFNPEDTFYKWHTAEFSPDGKYIVSQLEFRSGSDSVYIYDVETLKLNNVLLNALTSNSHFSFDKSRNLLSTSRGKTLMIYNLDDKKLIEKYFTDGLPYFVVFSKFHNKIALGVGASKPYIYDYINDRFDYEYSLYAGPHSMSVDNVYIICDNLNNISLLIAKWDVTSSVNGNSYENSISPNPTTGSINVSLTNNYPSHFKYELISNNGQIVISHDIGFLKEGKNNLSIDLSSVSNGQYILQIISDQEEFIFNVIKEN